LFAFFVIFGLHELVLLQLAVMYVSVYCKWRLTVEKRLLTYLLTYLLRSAVSCLVALRALRRVKEGYKSPVL